MSKNKFIVELGTKTVRCTHCGTKRNLIYLNSTKTKTICLDCKIVEEKIEDGRIITQA
jgi:Zn finger protein HypA/HybF involved in hydrogenase expression